MNIFNLNTNIDDAEVILLPVPWETTVSYRKGTSKGPKAILQASSQVDMYDRDFPLSNNNFYMLPIDETIYNLSGHLQRGHNYGSISLDVVNDGCQKMVDFVYEQTKKYIHTKKIGLVGGDHSTPLGYIKALSEIHHTFGILQIDSHCDLREDYNGLKYSHASIMHNVLKRGGSMRILIPSHLAYGVSGYGTGSKNNVNSRIAGNQCLDYYVHAINNQPAYDDVVIQSYMSANGFTGYQKTASGLWYKIVTPGIGTDPITINTTVTSTYTGELLNGNIFDQYNTADGSGIAKEFDTFLAGSQEGLQKYATVGTALSLFMPSKLGYGAAGTTGVPGNSVLHFEYIVTSVTP